VVLACTAATGPDGRALVSQERGENDAGRSRAPDDLTCSPNDLTAYKGVVMEYHREMDRTRLRIRTDSARTERVTIRHPGNEDPSPWFLFKGLPFADSDWSRIESRHGRLRPGVRATAWVCADGRTRVDWDGSRE